MAREFAALDSPGWLGLVCNLLLVWAAIAVSTLGPIVLGVTIGGGGGLRDAPWTPPGWFIGAVWLCLYTLLGFALWSLNRVNQPPRGSLKAGVFVLLIVLVTWTFFAFNQTSRLPGLLGNIAILIVVLVVVWRTWPHSQAAALIVAPVAVWITIATATILDGTRLYGW